MTIREYERTVEELMHGDITDIHVSPDFQCDQTDGFPTSLCVNWEKGKAWIALNESMIADGEDVTQYLQGCADFGIRNCTDTEDFNALLQRLGDEAYENAALYEDEELTMGGMKL